jgi:methyl-accepting chemotaxis protein
MVLILGEAGKIAYEIQQDRAKIEENGALRGDAALDMLEAVHVQAMLNRGQIEDGDPAVATLDGTMDLFSKSNENIKIWIAMADKVIAFQKTNKGRVLEPRDEIDRSTLTSLSHGNTVVGETLRLSRPVVLGKGTAADERCGGCHTGLMNIENGEPLGVYSAAIDLAPEMAAWRQTVWTRIAEGVGMLAITLAVIMGLLRLAVIKPLRRLADLTSQLAGGNTGAAAIAGERRDEIGAMARALEIFREALVSKKRLEDAAEGQRLKSEADRLEAQRAAESAAAQRLRIATSGLGSGLKQLASGDLATQLDEAFAPEFEDLRSDFNVSVQQLGKTLAAISQSASTIDGGTSEISQGTNDLSIRTEQQAVSLEKTVSALNQITQNVTSSSMKAEEARVVAVQANASAGKSGIVVSDAEEAMGRIETSSQKISSIIGVIDEIAFQTNLLALNAGVEAARAGDAGKGFAVVAQEVRGLAQRSANAAKEIKDLIQNSSNEVAGGVRLVRNAGEALKTIGDYIVTINAHMEAIAIATREQSAGLAEVNSAITNMDHVTQQNAAMVEESNAASATLADEAAKLRELVSHFRLERGGNAAVATHRPVSRVVVPAAKPHLQTMKSVPVSRGNTAPAADNWEEF